MKASLLTISLALVALIATPIFGLETGATQLEAADRATTDAFTGRIVFHQKDGQLIYDLTVTNGQVSGKQHFGNPAEPVAQVVGGWFDLQQGTLSVLIQGSNVPDAKWRAQAQHFRVEPKSKQVLLEHALYGHGLTAANSPIYADHVLDTLDRVEHLAKQD